MTHILTIAAILGWALALLNAARASRWKSLHDTAVWQAAHWLNRTTEARETIAAFRAQLAKFTDRKRGPGGRFVSKAEG